MSDDLSARIELLISKLTKSGVSVNPDLIRDAYEFARQAHKKSFRRSGEPYIDHPVSVAEILSELKVDDVTIAAAFLHDVIEDTDISPVEIKERFGKTVFDIVDGVTKISEMHYPTLEEKQTENYRKLIISMIKDLRVIMIKFADRLHNMRTLHYMRPEKQKRIAKETLDIYAPLAYRLGMYKMKNEFEDRSFEILEPESFNIIRTRLEKTYDFMDQYIKKISPVVLSELESHGIEGTVNGRIKHYYSIYNKLKTRKKSFEEILDIIALRIIIPDDGDCYKVLSVVHKLFKPVPGMINDYVAAPKDNGYQSIHTKVIFDNKVVEIQIRTSKMHELAEFGLAAHWRYKSLNGAGAAENALDEYILRLRNVLQESFDAKDPKDILEDLKVNLISGEVFVFTPKKDLVILPSGSTPIDFAYKIHENVGNHCIAAKRSGRVIPLETILENGDVIEIITSPKMTPSFDWLRFTKSPRARSSIRQYLRKIEYERTVKLGRDIFVAEIEKYHIKINRDALKSVLISFGFKNSEDFYYAVGNAEIKPNHFMRKISSVRKEGIFDKLVQKIRIKSPEDKKGYSVRSSKSVKYAKCCHPLPGDSVVGETTPDGLITIHLSNCPSIGQTDPSNLLTVNWEIDKGDEFQVSFKVAAEDRPNLLYEFIKVMNSLNVSMTYLEIKTENSVATANFTGKVKSLNHYIKLRKKILDVKGVLSMERS